MTIEIADRLVKLRKKYGYSQEELADKLGLSRQAVSKWERAEASPDTDNLICLAKLYGVSLDELLATDEDIDTIVKEQVKEEEKKEDPSDSEDEKKHDRVVINDDGVVINDKDGKRVTINDDGVTCYDKDGNIVNGIKDMLGLTSNTKDVLVYEMSDGSALNVENHYRLYKYSGSDYELVTMEKGSEVARYNPGKGLDNMKPIKGRLYLTDLEPGNYKVSDDNGSEVTFTINEDLTLSGHVKEYIPSNSNIESTGEAKLLITIQTGIRKVNYMLMAISLIVVLSIMFVIKRKSQNNKNLV